MAGEAPDRGGSPHSGKLVETPGRRQEAAATRRGAIAAPQSGLAARASQIPAAAGRDSKGLGRWTPWDLWRRPTAARRGGASWVSPHGSTSSTELLLSRGGSVGYDGAKEASGMVARGLMVTPTVV